LPLSPSPAFSGHLSLRAAVRDHGRTVLAAQSFRAPFHVGKSYWDPDAATLVVQVVNPTAGIRAGDRLESHIAVDPGAALLVTTPSASRVFTMRDGDAASVQTFAVADDGWLEVLPEPLVPHRGSRFHQRTVVDVAPAGGLFFVDQLVAGRIGHGEAWGWDRLRLDLTVRIAGELVLRERFDQSGAGLRDLAALAGTGDTTCFANAIVIAPAAATASPAWLPALAALHRDGVWLGVSALRRGGWSLKIVAPDTIRLRDTLRAARAVLAAQFPRLRAETRKL
jgi:urease accessory protein